MDYGVKEFCLWTREERTLFLYLSLHSRQFFPDPRTIMKRSILSLTVPLSNQQDIPTEQGVKEFCLWTREERTLFLYLSLHSRQFFPDPRTIMKRSILSLTVPLSNQQDIPTEQGVKEFCLQTREERTPKPLSSFPSVLPRLSHYLAKKMILLVQKLWEKKIKICFRLF